MTDFVEKDFPLYFDKENGVWTRKDEPYMKLDIETIEDYEYLRDAVSFFENRDNYVEVKRGYWISVGKNVHGQHLKQCSVCKGNAIEGGLFCRNCGAEMSLKQMLHKGDRVIMRDTPAIRADHAMDPGVYPAPGTVGVIVEVDNLPPSYLVHWENGGTDFDECWWICADNVTIYNPTTAD